MTATNPAAPDPGPALRLLSLDARVRSTTVLLLACEGKISPFGVACSPTRAGSHAPSTPTSNGSPRTPRRRASRCAGSRRTTLVLLAHAFLAIVTVTAHARPTPTGLIR